MNLIQYFYNTKPELDKMYQDLLEQFLTRPSRTHSQLVELECSRVNGAVKSLRKRVMNAIRRDLETLYGYDKAVILAEEIENRATVRQFQPIQLAQNTSAHPERTYVQTKKVVKQQVKQPKDLEQKVLYSAVGGASIGGMAGLTVGTISKSVFFYSSLGFVGGAILAGALGYHYFNKPSYQMVEVNVEEEQEPVKQQIEEVTAIDPNVLLNKRHQEVEQYIHSFISQLENELVQIKAKVV